MIIINEHGIYELPHNLKVWEIRKYEENLKSSWNHSLASGLCQYYQHFVNTIKKLLKKKIEPLLAILDEG